MRRNWWRRVVQPSTVALWQEGRRSPGYSWRNWVHGYIYGRWTYLYIGIGTGEHPLARTLGPLVFGLASVLNRVRPARPAQAPEGERITFADTYHGKVVPLEAATRLVQVNEDIRLPDLEQVIPYQRARDLILKNPDHIVVLDCPCRSSRPDPCLPLDVCLIVGEPFASFVLEHHPSKARPITPAEAVEILRAEDERGHIHHAFFKEAMLNRFYAICNCCSCCCGALQAQRNGTPMLASSGYVAQVDEELCLACGECQSACAFGGLVFTTEEQMQDRLYGMLVDEEKCMGCGLCVSQCENGGISLRRAPEKGEPLEICDLLAAALPASAGSLS